ncbi:MAG: oxidoreductase [Candidatus Omnitrophica bacterium CG1_02_40_15]|nr:MAG: oxidoreductase [Candidatus Omnitrophica bacterium CG1_02_40_15]
MDKNFIGLIGAGYWGKNLLRNLYQMGVLAACCDSDENILGRAKKEFPGIKCVKTPDELFKDARIKAVAVASPASTHCGIVEKALHKNKDVFVEKPLALTLKEGRELVDIAKRKKRILMVGHILHYHPAIIKLKSLINAGALGKIQYIYSNRLNIGKLRTEENILWSFAPHDISVMLMLVGEEPVNVVCFGGDYVNKGIYDTTMTTLEFKSGPKGHIFVSWLHPYKEQKLIVVGSQAMAVFDDLTSEKLFLYHHKIEWKNGKIPVAHKADYEIVPVEKKEPLREELEHFVQCVNGRKQPDTDGYEGLRVLKILSLCEKSLKAGR